MSLIGCSLAFFESIVVGRQRASVIVIRVNILVLFIYVHTANDAANSNAIVCEIIIVIDIIIYVRIICPRAWLGHVAYPCPPQRIPPVLILVRTGHVSFKLRIDVNITSCAFRNLLLIPAAGNPIRQRPHRHQIDEHQRRHQNGYKAFYFIPHCLILLFHLEAALALLPERSKRICGQTLRRLKKRFGKNGRVIPARRFPPPRRALRVQPPPRARQPPRARRPQASARSGQRGDSSN